MDPLTWESTFALLRRFWPAIPIALLFAALMFTRHTLGNVKAERDGYKAQTVRLVEKLNTTTASLNAGLAIINERNRQIAEQAARFEADKRALAAATARADERWSRTRGVVSTLEASARDRTQPPCKVSEAAARGLEGL